MRPWPLAALLLVLATAMPLPASAVEQEGVRLLFPDPSWADGDAMLAELQTRMNRTVGLAMHFDGVAEVSPGVTDGGDVLHRVKRVDGTVDRYRIPISTPRLYRPALDLDAMGSLLVVRQRQTALEAYVPLGALSEPWEFVQIKESTPDTVLRGLAQIVATKLGIPAGGAGEWRTYDTSPSCDFGLQIPDYYENFDGDVFEYATGTRFSAEDSGLGGCRRAEIGPESGYFNTTAVSFFLDRPWVHVRSTYWIDHSEAGLPHKAVLRDILREEFVGPFGRPFAFHGSGSLQYDGWDMRLERAWQPASHAFWMEAQPCDRKWHVDLLQDAVEGRPWRVKQGFDWNVDGCPRGGTPASTVAPVRAENDPAGYALRVPVGPPASDPVALAEQVEEVLGPNTVEWALRSNGPSGAISELSADRIEVRIKAEANERASVLRFGAEYEPGPPPYPITEPIAPTTPGSESAEPAPSQRPSGYYVDAGVMPTTILGIGIGFRMFVAQDEARLDSLDDVSSLLRDLGYPIPSDASWQRRWDSHALVPLYVGGDLLHFACDCVGYRLVGDWQASGFAYVDAETTPNGRVVAFMTTQWIDEAAWGVLPREEAIDAARAALLEEFAAEATFTSLTKHLGLAEIWYQVRFRGADAYGQERAWTVTVHGHTGQPVHIAADPPLYPDWKERIFAEYALGPTWTALLAGLGVVLLTRRWKNDNLWRS